MTWLMSIAACRAFCHAHPYTAVWSGMWWRWNSGWSMDVPLAAYVAYYIYSLSWCVFKVCIVTVTLFIIMSVWWCGWLNRVSGRKSCKYIYIYIYSVPIQIQSVYWHKHCTAVFAIARVWWVYKVDGRRFTMWIMDVLFVRSVSKIPLT